MAFSTRQTPVTVKSNQSLPRFEIIIIDAYRNLVEKQDMEVQMEIQLEGVKTEFLSLSGDCMKTTS